MKYCRFLLDGQIRYGAVEDRNGELWIAGPSPAPAEDLAYRVALDETGASNFDFAPMPLSAAHLLPPVTPSKIVCVGRNYREHVRELNNEMPAEPLLFFKPPSSLLAPGGVVRLPAVSERVDFEGELALVIGRRIRNLKPEANWRERCPRLHPRQRHLRPRPAEERRAVDARQRLRHLLSRRPLRQRRTRPRRGPYH